MFRKYEVLMLDQMGTHGPGAHRQVVLIVQGMVHG